MLYIQYKVFSQSGYVVHLLAAPLGSSCLRNNFHHMMLCALSLTM